MRNFTCAICLTIGLGTLIALTAIAIVDPVVIATAAFRSGTHLSLFLYWVAACCFLATGAIRSLAATPRQRRG